MNQISVISTRKRKYAVLNGDENHNEKLAPKRAKITLATSQSAKTKSTRAIKLPLKLQVEPKPFKQGKNPAKVKVKATSDKKLKGTAILKKIKVVLKKKVTSRTSRKMSQKITKTKTLKVPKKNSLKKIVNSKPSENRGVLKKKKSNKKALVPKDSGVLKTKKSNKKGLVPKDNVTEYLKEPTFETNEYIPHVSTVAHSRLLIRAINLNDTNLLKSLMNDKKSICSFTVPRSLNINRDAFSYALERRNMEAIKILIDSKLSENLASFPDIILSDERTGHNSTMMLGHAVRNVTVGRGGKEGNNALLKDRNMYYGGNGISVNHITQDIAKEALSFGLPKPLIQKLSESFPDLQSTIYSNFYNNTVSAIRAGHNLLAGQLIEEALTKGGYGFNLLHKEVLLNTKEPLSAFKSVSVVKKVFYNDRVTPLHCAAINPNPIYLTTLLNSRPDYSILDTQNWSIIHYAAVCTGTGPLQVLLARGISTLQINKDGDTPLHLASALGRIEHVKLILDSEKESEEVVEDDTPKHVAGTLVERVNKIGRTALHSAAAAGQTEIIPILLTAGANPNKSTPARYEKLTPLMLAARHGHVEALKVFVLHGVKVDVVDHKGRTALAHAIINGQAHVVSYLLRIGANNLKKDTSGNTMVHYAGKIYCVKRAQKSIEFKVEF